MFSKHTSLVHTALSKGQHTVLTNYFNRAAEWWNTFVVEEKTA
jgi:hypothetical protein